MKNKKRIRNRQLVQTAYACMLVIFSFGNVFAQEKSQLVRLAKLVIDSTQLESYKAALKEEIEASVRLEPGVLTLYAVSEKNNPTHITILEIYADTDWIQSAFTNASFHNIQEYHKGYGKVA